MEDPSEPTDPSKQAIKFLSPESFRDMTEAEQVMDSINAHLSPTPPLTSQDFADFTKAESINLIHLIDIEAPELAGTKEKLNGENEQPGYRLCRSGEFFEKLYNTLAKRMEIQSIVAKAKSQKAPGLEAQQHRANFWFLSSKLKALSVFREEVDKCAIKFLTCLMPDELNRVVRDGENVVQLRFELSRLLIGMVKENVP